MDPLKKWITLHFWENQSYLYTKKSSISWICDMINFLDPMGWSLEMVGVSPKMLMKPTHGIPVPQQKIPNPSDFFHQTSSVPVPKMEETSERTFFFSYFGGVGKLPYNKPYPRSLYRYDHPKCCFFWPQRPHLGFQVLHPQGPEDGFEEREKGRWSFERHEVGVKIRGAKKNSQETNG